MNNFPQEQRGHLFACDKNGRHIMIEWYLTTITSSCLADFKKEVSDIASMVTAQSEAEFLKHFPEAVSSGGFLKSCELLFAHGVEQVNWMVVEQKLQDSIKQFYQADLSCFGQEIINKLMHDIYFFAAIRDQSTSQLRGFLMSSITPALPAGDIKLINLIVSPHEENNSLEKLLLGSLIRMLPQAKRIFTMVRPTNTYTLQTLESCGFIEDENPIQDPHHPIDTKYLTVLEYKTNQSNILQKTAESLSQ
jgi:hypothetical protein